MAFVTERLTDTFSMYVRAHLSTCPRVIRPLYASADGSNSLKFMFISLGLLPSASGTVLIRKDLLR